MALVVLTAVLGSWQLRAQGLATLGRARMQLDRGELPARELFDGLCLVAAGALLLTPGFMTDSIGLVLFVPGARDWLRRYLASRMETAGKTRVWVDGAEVTPGEGRPRPGPGGKVIEGEFRDVSNDSRSDDDDDEPPRGRLPR